jgi:hypothetical protein
MLRWLKNLFNKRNEVEIVKVNDEIEVESEDDARLKIAELCLKSGKIIAGSVDWQDNGTGTLKVTSVQELK